MSDEFQVGDNVVYPPHGAGTVTKREVNELTGVEMLSIYIVHSKMTLGVPAAGASDKGVRRVMDAKEAKSVLSILKGDFAELPDNPQHRRTHLDAKSRTGGMAELAEVIRDLTGRASGGKKLSPPETTVLDKAKQTLASELMFTKDLDIAGATELIDKTLAASPAQKAAQAAAAQ